MPLNDNNKRLAIKTQLGFDVDAAIKLKNAGEETSNEDKKVEAPVKPAGRRAQSTIIIPKKEESKKTVITIPGNNS